MTTIGQVKEMRRAAYTPYPPRPGPKRHKDAAAARQARAPPSARRMDPAALERG